MITLTNYTQNMEREFSHMEHNELELYLKENSGDEIGVTACDIISINTIEEAIELLQLDEDKLEMLQLIEATCGYSYFNSLDEALEEIENIMYIRIDGATTMRETAYKLDYEACYEDDLYMILGCSASSYAELGRYVDTDSIAHTLETEYNVIFAGSNAYIILQ